MAVLGIDLGTQSVKVVAVGDDGQVRASATRAYPVQSAQPGWAETDPADWVAAVDDAAAEVLGLLSERPLAIGLSGQMHGVVLVDEQGEAMRPAILWADSRSAEQARRLRTGLGDDELARLGSAPFPGFAGPTLAWCAQHEPALLAEARWALQPKDWLRMRLLGATDVPVRTDPSDASGTLLYDLTTGDWSPAAASACGVREELLPPIAASDTLAGVIHRPGSVLDGLPIAIGGADAACAVHGLGLEVGQGSVTLGTGSQIACLLDAPRPDPSLRTHTFATVGLPGAGYFRLGAVQSGGLALERALGWLGASIAEAQSSLAEGVRADDPMFWPFVAGERSPYIDPDLRGAWSGLSLATTRSALLRSVLEGMAYAVSAAFEAVIDSGAVPEQPILVLGGGSRDHAYVQLVSSAMGATLQPATVGDATAIGAARLGGRVVDVDIPPARRSGHDMVEPAPNSLIEDRQRRWRETAEGMTRP